MVSMKIRNLFLLTAILLLLDSNAAWAQCADFGIPLNRSYEVNAAHIEQQILAGCDPHCRPGDNDWCMQAGRRRGSPGSGGASVITNVSKARMDCPPTKKQDDTCQTEFPDCYGKPGGRSDGGAESVCDKGRGSATDGLRGIQTGVFPGFPLDFLDCLFKFLSGLDFSSSGGFISSFTNNVTVQGGIGYSEKGICAGGSIGFCGFSVGGEICLGDEDGNPVPTLVPGESFVEITAPSSVFFGADTDFTQGPVFAVDGGTLDGYGSIPAGSVLAGIVDSPDGSTTGLYLFPPGTSQSDIQDGDVIGDKIFDLTPFQSADVLSPFSDGLRLQLNGLARIPVENVQSEAQGGDDSDRLEDAREYYYLPSLF